MQTKSQRVAPVTAEELQTLFDRAGVTVAWFCEATGADRRRARRWLDGSEPSIPLWAATFLLALCTPEALAEVHAWLTKYRNSDRG